MIMTTEYTELLFVEAANMRQIYDKHKKAMEGLLTAAAGSHEQGDTVDSGDRDSVTSATDSELTMAGVTLHQLIQTHFKELIRWVLIRATHHPATGGTVDLFACCVHTVVCWAQMSW